MWEVRINQTFCSFACLDNVSCFISNALSRPSRPTLWFSLRSFDFFALSRFFSILQNLFDNARGNKADRSPVSMPRVIKLRASGRQIRRPRTMAAWRRWTAPSQRSYRSALKVCRPMPSTRAVPVPAAAGRRGSRVTSGVCVCWLSFFAQNDLWSDGCRIFYSSHKMVQLIANQCADSVIYNQAACSLVGFS